MANHNRRASKRQPRTQPPINSLHPATKAAHELIDSFQRILPCEAMPIVQSACGCSSVDKILRGLNGEVDCPFEGIVDCPLKRTPTS